MYTKLFSSLLMSSIWSEDNATRILWITLLAAADCEGFIYGSPVGLSRQANISLDETLAGLLTLSDPDPYSGDLERNPENHGRRIEVVSGGWRIVNYAYYRELQRADDRREHERVKKQRQREAKGGLSPLVPVCPQMSPNVPQSPPSEAEAEAETLPTKGKRRPKKQPPPLASELQAAFDATWDTFPKKAGVSKADARIAWEASVKAGAAPAAIHSGTVQYAEWVKMKALLDPTWKPEYTKAPAVFWGRGRHWESDWTPPAMPETYLPNGNLNPAFLSLLPKEYHA